MAADEAAEMSTCKLVEQAERREGGRRGAEVGRRRGPKMPTSKLMEQAERSEDGRRGAEVGRRRGP